MAGRDRASTTPIWFVRAAWHLMLLVNALEDQYTVPPNPWEGVWGCTGQKREGMAGHASEGWNEMRIGVLRCRAAACVL